MISSTANFDTAVAKLAKQNVYLLEITGAPRAFINYDMSIGGQDPWMVSAGSLREATNDLNAQATLGDLEIIVVDSGGLVTADFPFTFEGRACTLKHGFPSMVQGDFVTLFTGIVDRVESIKNNTAYKFVCKGNYRKVKKQIYIVGDDATLPISSDNPRTLEDHPLNILKNVLLTQVGLLAGEVDSTVIDAYRDEVFPGVRFSFSLTASVDTKTFLESQLLKPLGGYGRLDNLGVFTVRFFFPRPGTLLSVKTLTDQNLRVLPVAAQSELKNVVVHRYDDEKAQNVSKRAASITKFSLEGVHTIVSSGMRTNLQAASLARQVAESVFNWYSDKNFRLAVEVLWADGVLLEPGDIVKVTHDKVPDRAAGSMGVTDKLFSVLYRSWDFEKGRVRLTLLDASGVTESVGAADGIAKISPNDKLEWALEDSGDKLTYMFVADLTDGLMSDDSTKGHVLA